MDTNGLIQFEGPATMASQWASSLPSAEEERPSSSSTSQLELLTAIPKHIPTQGPEGILQLDPLLCSPDWGPSYMGNYGDLWDMGLPDDWEDRLFNAAVDTRLIRAGVEDLNTLEDLDSAVASVFFGAYQTIRAEHWPGNQKSAGVSTNRPKGGTATSDNSKRQYFQRGDESIDVDQPNPKRGKREPRYGKFLSVGRPYENDEPPARCPRCTWTLLSKPQGSPNAPVLMATDPDGVVMYPHDHTYYADDDEAGDDEDGWD